MYILTVYLPFISFFFCFFFGRLLNNVVAGIFSSLCVFFSLLVAFLIFYEVAICQAATYVNIADWISCGLLEVRWTFGFDVLTSVMLLVILSISLCAHVYSIDYMISDPHQIKFMSYLSLFTFFMILLVTSSNLVMLFLGWEGVGIASYLLINFWHTRVSANKSAIMAMYVNKIGDISLLIAFTLIYLIFYSFDYAIFFGVLNADVLVPYSDVLYFICIFFIIGAVGKSAQIGLHTWLPEAMEGPTPVSSLIHAATMVTAGIFLIIRCNFLFQYINDSLIFIITLGSLTAFLGSTIGVFQMDIKKIVAYSTCSQLGYMFLACGLSGYQFSIYHLTNHAFFKALLFLTAGYIIHALNNEQDIRKLGGLLFVLPFAYMCITIGSLSLLGFPFFSGFFSKERIIELFYSTYFCNIGTEYTLNYLLFLQFLASISVTFTILYSIKVSVYTFLYVYHNRLQTLFSLHYSSLFTLTPLFFLGILSVCSGYILEDMMIGIGNNFWNGAIYGQHFNRELDINYFEFNLLTSKLPALFVVYFISLFSFLFYNTEHLLFYFKIHSNWSEVFNVFFNKKYFIFNKNLFYPIINSFFRLSYHSMYTFFDKGLIEILGPFGIVNQLKILVLRISKLQTGLIYHYSGFFIISLIFFISIILYYYQ